MATLIFSNGIITKRKNNQSINSHIKTHEKNSWIKTYMKIDNCSIQEAEQAFKKMEESK